MPVDGEETHLVFKLYDPSKLHHRVNVAGTFNNWNPNGDLLSFDLKTKTWLLDLLVDLPVNERVLYKYIVDEGTWICDGEAPSTKDELGNENNVTYVVAITRDQPEAGQKDNGPLNNTSDHENELFEPNEDAVQDGGSAPSSGESDTHNDVPQASQVLTRCNVHKSDFPDTPNVEEHRPTTSFWDQVKWFFHYLLSWFYPQTQT